MRARRLVLWAGTPAVLLALLSIPSAAPLPPPSSPATPFAWQRDSLWHRLEATFVAARDAGCGDPGALDLAFRGVARDIDAVGAGPLDPGAPVLDRVELRYMVLGALVAACPGRLDDYAALQVALRGAVKEQARHWDLESSSARDRLYRLLYGSRAALEEVLLQHPEHPAAVLQSGDEPSAGPGAMSHGVMLRSGDMLVSRGGYPTSALIARGSDHPGNFSHVGLVHVDSATGAISVIEAHIEAGVKIATAEEYLADKKLRVLVLRPRHDLPQLVRDPLLPHRAATAMRDRAMAGHIPYDFAMDYRDPSRLFCSEVASSAYHDLGVDLWMKLSTISADGLRRWLAAFGVRHFETQEPSDLEYDPQLVVVAEWRDPALLFRDHVDNAVTDAMLEAADHGAELEPSWWQWPLGRVLKGYSWVRERLGQTGPIPEGMSVGAALRSRAYTAIHARLADRVTAAAVAWQAAHGYPPPYWTLVALAERAVGERAGPAHRRLGSGRAPAPAPAADPARAPRRT